MTFIPQNFVNGTTPVISAQWLNGIDQLANNVFSGAISNAAAVAALFTPQGGAVVPLAVGFGGTGATTGPQALINLGAVPASGATSIIPETPNAESLGSPSIGWEQVYVGPTPVPVFDSTAGNVGYYAPTAAEIAAGLTIVEPSKANSPFFDMSRYGFAPNQDNTALWAKVLVMLAAANGGTLFFPTAAYPGYVDFSASNVSIIIEANGSTFCPFTPTPAQSAAVYCNNSGMLVGGANAPCGTDATETNFPTSWTDSNVEWRNAIFSGRLYTGGSPATDQQTAVALYGTAMKFKNCAVYNSVAAGLYGCYTQYTQCLATNAYLCNSTANSYGMKFTGYGNTAGSNEVLIDDRCVFQVNANGLGIFGAFKVRVFDSNFQRNGILAATALGSISGNVLTISALATGAFAPGQAVRGNSSNPVVNGTYITAQLTGTPGSAGTYSISIPQTVAAGSSISGTSLGAIVLGPDPSGFGCIMPDIWANWFEVNIVDHIFEILSVSMRVEDNIFNGGGTYLQQISTNWCSDIVANRNLAYATPLAFTVNYPSGDTGTISVAMKDNSGFVPALNTSHPGATVLDISSASSASRQNDNMLLTTNQVGASTMPLIQTDQFGFKTGVLQSVTTNLFQINLQNFPAGPYQVNAMLIIELYAVQDTQPNTSYAYCGRVQRFYAMITNNSGNIAALISPAIDGADLSLSPVFQEIGVISLGAAPFGSVAAGNASVTFNASFPGAGTGAPGVTSATIGYTVRMMAGNPLTFTRL